MNEYMDKVKRHRLPIVIFVVFLAMPIFVRSPFILTLFIMFFFYAYLALCWNWIGGYAGQLNIAHGAFFGIGAYTTAVLFINFRLTPWLGMFAGAILATVVAFVIGVFTFRYKIKGFYFALVTLAITLIFLHLVSSFEFTGTTVGLYIPVDLSWYGFQFRSRNPYYYIALTMLIMSIFISLWIERNKIGFYLKAIREDEESASSIGVNTTRYKTYALCLSAFFTALAGTFSAQFFWYVDPESGFSLEVVFNVILMVMVGGSGTISGPILGAMLVTLVGEGLRYMPMSSQEIAAISKMIYAVILMLVVIFLKHGIVEIFSRKKRAL
jgi:branched-chain amino acid transport system permease protein